jgi:PAS domain S-box-containing protein
MSGEDMTTVENAGLRLFFEQSQDACLLSDPAGRITLWNQGAEELFGLAAGEAVGQAIWELLARFAVGEEYGDDIAGRLEATMRAAQAGTDETLCHGSLINTVRRKDGQIRQVRCRLFAFPDGSGRRWGGIVRDLTVQLRNELELAKLSQATEQSPATVVITDLKGRIEYVNRKFTDLTGFSREEAIGNNPRILQSGMTPREEYGNLWATILAGKEWRGIFQNRKKNGESYWESASIAPIFDATGAMINFVAVKEDITARLKVEAALNERIKELKGIAALHSDMMVGPGVSEFCRRVVSHVVPSMQFPEQAIAWIELGRDRYVSRSPVPLLAKSLDAEILVDGNVAGKLVVGYAEDLPLIIPEEMNFVQIVALGIGNYIERHRAAAAVRESLERFQLMLNASPDAIVLTRPADGLIVECNTRFSDLFGYSREEAISLTKLQLAIWCNPADRDDALRRVEQGDLRNGQEYRFRKCTGADFTGLYQAYYLHLNGEPHILSIIRDLTTQKQAEDALRYQASLLAQVSDAIISTDLKFRIYTMNAAAERLYGRSQLECRGRRVSDVFHTEFRIGDELSVARQLAETGRWQGEVVQTRGDGQRLSLLSSVSLLRDTNGQAYGAVAVNRDITERVAMEGQLRRARDEADRANRAKSDFLASMSHELRTPLNAIIGFSQLLEQPGSGGLNPRQAQYLKNIRLSGDHLLNLISSTLDLAKIEAGKIEIDKQPFELAPMLEALLIIMRGMAEKKDIDLRLDMHGVLGTLFADETKVGQILYNLLTNALKFTARGKRVGLETRPDGGQVVFTVWDEGPGISLKDQDRIFGAYEQVLEHKVANQGAGLGLYITRNLVQLHGGEISLESRPGEGSRFTVVLPGRSDPGTNAAAVTEAPAIVKRSWRFCGRILIVEDSEITQELMEAVMESYGCSFAVAGTGEEAVALALREPFDLILMDIDLRGIDGMEASRRIRAGLAKKVPIVALTAHVMAGDTERFLADGIDAVISKPVQLPKLQALLSEYGVPQEEEPVPDNCSDPEEKPPLYRPTEVAEGLGIDVERLMTIVVRFLAELAPAYAANLRKAVDTGHTPDIRYAAHKFKGAAANLRLEALANCLAEIETAAEHGAGVDFPKLCGQVEAELAVLKAEVLPDGGGISK